LSGVVALFLAGCALLPAVNTDRSTDGLPTPTPIPTAVVPTKPTYKVQKGEIVSQLEFSGRVSPQKEDDLFFRTDGRVAKVLAKRNDMVKKGQVLAELEIEDLQRNLESSQISLQQAQVHLTQAEEDHSYQADVAQTNLDIANLQLQSMQNGTNPDPTQIAIQQKQVHLAQLEVDRLNQGVDPLLKSDVVRATLELSKTEAAIEDAQVIAPYDGQLLSISLTPGQAVTAFGPVASVADISLLEVSADLVSNQMEDLSEGMSAVVFLTSRPGVTIKGKVRQLPYPYGSGGKGQTVEDMDKSTRVAIDPGQNTGFDLGDLVRVTVELERKQDILWVPPQAIRLFDGRRFAVLQDGDLQRRVDVTVGIETPDRVEIKTGLEAGQTVVGQ